MEHKNWYGFKTNLWQDEINVRDFIINNYQEYTGDDSFLAKATDRTNTLMSKVFDLFKQEREKGGVLDIDTETISSLRNYKPSFL